MFLVQWNCNGYHLHREQLNLLISEQCPLIICLQETHTRNTHPVYPPKSYSGYFKSRTNQHRASGGVGILTKQTKNIKPPRDDDKGSFKADFRRSSMVKQQEWEEMV
nr:unnamed protein product [Callosobruchus analis]